MIEPTKADVEAIADAAAALAAEMGMEVPALEIPRRLLDSIPGLAGALAARGIAGVAVDGDAVRPADLRRPR